MRADGKTKPCLCIVLKAGCIEKFKGTNGTIRTLITGEKTTSKRQAIFFLQSHNNCEMRISYKTVTKGFSWKTLSNREVLLWSRCCFHFLKIKGLLNILRNLPVSFKSKNNTFKQIYFELISFKNIARICLQSIIYWKFFFFCFA